MIVNTAINCSLKRSFKLQSAKCKVQSAKLRKNLRAQTSEMPGNRNRFLSVPLTRSGREGFSGEWCSAQRIYNPMIAGAITPLQFRRRRRCINWDHGHVWAKRKNLNLMSLTFRLDLVGSKKKKLILSDELWWTI